MKILHFGPETAEPIRKYGSNFTMSHMHKVGRELFAGSVNHLEYTALRELLGNDAARRILEFWQHYTWIYRTVLNQTEQIDAIVTRNNLGI